jgi:hypothetical protein
VSNGACGGEGALGTLPPLGARSGNASSLMLALMLALESLRGRLVAGPAPDGRRAFAVLRLFKTDKMQQCAHQEIMRCAPTCLCSMHEGMDARAVFCTWDIF